MLACEYCGKLLSHRISEHFQHCHIEKPEVAKAYCHPPGQKRNMALALLKNKGNFRYNVKILAKGRTDIIVTRVPHAGVINPKDYLPAPCCKGFYLKKDLWRHVKECSFNEACDEKTKYKVGVEAQMMLCGALLPESITTNDEAQLLLAKLGVTMDNIGKVILHDELILKFVKILHDKLGDRWRNDISQRSHQLARLKVQINKDYPHKHLSTFYKILAATNFDIVVESTRNLAVLHQNEDGIMVFKKPALALRLAHLLGNLSKVKYGVAFIEDDTVGENESEQFSIMLKNEWNDAVTSIAMDSLTQNRGKKCNKPQLLPLTEDLVVLNDYLKVNIPKLTQVLRINPTYAIHHELSENVMTKSVLLNKQRGTETSKLLKTAYTEKTDWKQATCKEIIESLSSIEQQKFNKYVFVHFVCLC